MVLGSPGRSARDARRHARLDRARRPGRRSSSRSSWRWRVAASRIGRPVVAGLCAFVAVAVLAVVAGSLLDAVGLAGDVSLFDQDLELAPLLGEIAVLVAALYAARKLRFPLLLLAATIAKAVLVLDTVAGVVRHGQLARLGGAAARVRRSSAPTVALRGDRSPWAFWKHAVAALLIGAAVVLAPRRKRRRLGADRPRLARLPRRGALDRPLGLGRRRRARAPARRPRTSSTRATRSSGWSGLPIEAGRAGARALADGARLHRRSASCSSLLGRLLRQPTLHVRDRASAVPDPRMTADESRRPRRAGQLPRARGDAARARRGRGRGAPARAARRPRRARDPGRRVDRDHAADAALRARGGDPAASPRPSSARAPG